LGEPGRNSGGQEIWELGTNLAKILPNYRGKLASKVSAPRAPGSFIIPARTLAFNGGVKLAIREWHTGGPGQKRNAVCGQKDFKERRPEGRGLGGNAFRSSAMTALRHRESVSF